MTANLKKTFGGLLPSKLLDFTKKYNYKYNNMASSDNHNKKFRVDNKVAIIYGGSYGIGKSISQILSQQGATVIIVARNQEKGEAAVQELPGKHKLFIQADVKNYNEHEQIVKKVVETYKQIDIIVCCAGIYPGVEITSKDYTLEYIDRLIDVNLKGSIYAVKSTVEYLKTSKHGRIVFISSVTGEFTGFNGFTVYGATKSAQIGFARSAAVELGTHGVTVNCVLPGITLTEGLLATGEDLTNVTKAIPLKRLGTPEDIGNTVLFLVSEEASYITGQEITVDGGLVRPES